MSIPLPMLDVVQREHLFLLTCNGEPVHTTQNREIAWPSQRLPAFIMQLLLMNDADLPGSLPVLGLYDLLQRVAADETSAPLPPDDVLLATDPFIDKAAYDQALGKADDPQRLIEWMQPPAPGMLLFDGLSSATRIFNRWLFDVVEGHMNYAGKTAEVVLPPLKAEMQTLSAAERTAVYALCARHAIGPVLPLLLLRGQLAITEYAHAVPALHPPQQAGHPLHPAWHGRLLDLAGVFPPALPGNGDVRDYLACLLRETTRILDFVTCADDGLPANRRLAELIRKGESFQVEFKTTLRWHIKAGKKDPAIEHAAMKTINAFLNASGGTLLIGVRDDGTAAGLDLDGFASEDKFALHFWNLVKAGMGEQVAPFVRASFESWQHKSIFCVRCARAPRPVFLRHKGGEEEFYIRMGPASARLSVREALDYISGRFDRNH